MQVTTDQLFRLAYGKFALGAFNIDNMEQTSGLFQGCMQADSPFIIALYLGKRRYASLEMLRGMLGAAQEIYPEAIFAVHLDHGDEESCYEGIASGFFTSVMIDASFQPFHENVAVTRRVVERAHARGINVEAELDVLTGIEEGAQASGSLTKLTDPNEAAEFVRLTGCDSLAVAIGTSHGAYKFKGRGSINLERLAEIQQRLPDFPLVLHGCSSVPAEEVGRINAAGGQISPSAQGVDETQLVEAIRLGVTKVNIATDGRLIWARVHREFFRDHPSEFDLRQPGRIFIEEYARSIEEKNRKMQAFGSLGQIKAALTRC